MPTKSGISRMRSHVSRLGMLKGISMQLVVNARGKFPADALHLRELVDPGRHQALQDDQPCQQALPPLGADAGDAFERRRIARLAAPRAMALDREAMRFVAYLLDQV